MERHEEIFFIKLCKEVHDKLQENIDVHLWETLIRE